MSRKPEDLLATHLYSLCPSWSGGGVFWLWD